MSELSRGRLKQLTWAYAAALILLVVTADRGALNISWLAGVPNYDKICHFVFFGLLSYLANATLACARWQWWRLSVLKGSALVMVVAVVEELSQLWIAHRAFDPADLTADLAGIWLAGQFFRQRPPEARAEPG